MKKNHLLAIFCLLAVAGSFFFLVADQEDNFAEIEALKRMQAERRATEFAEAAAKIAAGVKEGAVQKLPKEMRLTVASDQNSWIVETHGTKLAVEIPFRPGDAPTPIANIEPTQSNPGFLGADACQSCHVENYESFIETAHHLTSRVASPDQISGSFESGKNVMRTKHPEIKFTMIQRDGQCFQQPSFFDWQFEVPFHLVFGSSKMAETYAFWHGERLYEMNVSYLTKADRWINSPGFEDGEIWYARVITARCLECHSTYADYRKKPNGFTPSSLILGISCERCHGPGKDHVNYHEANPEADDAHQISVPTQFDRDRQLDICGQCHTSKILKNDRPYEFRPGDKLDDHYDSAKTDEDAASSVHTNNQVLRLRLSKCFQESQMGCVECHNPHRNERGQIRLFSERCLECHEANHCGMSSTLGPQLTENCIDCHMPKRASKELQVETAERTLFPPLRDHFIRIDRTATQKFMRTRRVLDDSTDTTSD